MKDTDIQKVMKADNRARKLRWQIPFLLLLIVGSYYAIHKGHTPHQAPFQKEEGNIFGTFYHVTYQCDSSLQPEINAWLNKVDTALSPFNKESTITRMNQNIDSVTSDSMFIHVVSLAQSVSAHTDGAFDITVAPLVNAWGFGFKHAERVDTALIDSLLTTVGYQKIKLEGGKLTKTDPRVILDCSAIAKGFGSDVIAHYFDSKGIKNYMIEIGGEIVVKGNNTKGEPWRVGVNKPIDDSLSMNNELQTILKLKDKALATSGNYRNFYYKDGKKYAHTINPKTGYPVNHSLLSATVIAPDCATADAYATAFMVMGLDKAKQLLSTHHELEAYLIYTTPDNINRVYATPGVKSMMVTP